MLRVSTVTVKLYEQKLMVSFLTIVWKTRHTNFKLKHMYLAEEVVFTEVNLLSGLPRH